MRARARLKIGVYTGRQLLSTAGWGYTAPSRALAWTTASLLLITTGCHWEKSAKPPSPPTSAQTESLRQEVGELKEQLRQLQQAQGESLVAAGHSGAAEQEPQSDRPTESAEHTPERRIRELIAELGNEDVLTVYKTARELKKIGKPAIPFLVEALGHTEKRVRRAAAVLLGELNATSAVPALVEAFQNATRTSDRMILAATLGRLRDERGLSALMDGLKAKDKQLQAVSARAIAQFEDSRAVPTLVDLLDSSDELVRGSAVYALKKIGEKGIPELSRALATTKGSTKVEVLNLLAEVGGDESIAAIQTALEDVNMYVRLAAARSLARLGNTDGLPVANEALRSSSPETRKFGMDIIQQLGDAVYYDPAIGYVLNKKE